MPFCDTTQVNALTSLLLEHGIRHTVVCPGSRNAVIVHNLHELGGRMSLYPVTDERSAAFVAIGLILALHEPVAVCVTSGSALLNCIPAVAEASFRHLPLLIVSADRPAAMIGQMDGQTLPQDGALMPYCRTFSVHEAHNDEGQWENNRKMNEAIVSLRADGGAPSHINVAISEPMFSFTTLQLPEQRRIVRFAADTLRPLPPEVISMIAEGRLPALVIGQYERGDIRQAVAALDGADKMLVLPEVISDVAGNFRMNAFDSLCTADNAPCPDVVVQIGGNFVHKRFKQFLRQSRCTVVCIDPSADMHDTFRHLSVHVQAAPHRALSQLAEALPAGNKNVRETKNLLDSTWQTLSSELHSRAFDGGRPLSFHYVLTLLRQSLSAQSAPFTLHLANSTAVRAAGQVFEAGAFPIFCNRGTNGIEGSLSSAVGYALKMWGLNIVVIGDLSFYYDVNALCNAHLPASLRILLMNNARGGIFDHLSGLEASPARGEYVSAAAPRRHADGVARTFGLDYQICTDWSEVRPALTEWLREGERAKILEIDLP